MSGEYYREVFVLAGTVYLTTVGYGTGALLGRAITNILDVHWLDTLGIAQAIWVLEVKDFGPLIVDCDAGGGRFFEAKTPKTTLASMPPMRG